MGNPQPFFVYFRSFQKNYRLNWRLQPERASTLTIRPSQGVIADVVGLGDGG